MKLYGSVNHPYIAGRINLITIVQIVDGMWGFLLDQELQGYRAYSEYDTEAHIHERFFDPCWNLQLQPKSELNDAA